MINDNLDIAHICIAVPELGPAMEHYGSTLGVEWSTILDIGPMPVPLYDSRGNDVSEGLQEVWSIKNAIDGGPSVELSCSAPGTASQAVWGVSPGKHRYHHICYYVDDLAAETAHLVANGFEREVSGSRPDLPPELFSYVVSPFGIRYELMRSRDKAAMSRWLATGELMFDD